MNEEQLRGRLNALRIPDSEFGSEEVALEKALAAFQSAKTPDRIVSMAESWTWKDWLWPSPYIWAAFAAVWIVFLSVDVMPGLSQEERVAIADPPEPALYFALNDCQVLLREFQQLHP